MKLQKILAVITIILGIVTAILPHYIAPVCEFKQTMEMEGDMVMACHYLVGPSLGIGIILVILGVITLIGTKKFAAGSFLATALLGLFVLAMPLFLIGVCMNPEAGCRVLTMPLMIIDGVILFIIGIIGCIKGAVAK